MPAEEFPRPDSPVIAPGDDPTRFVLCVGADYVILSGVHNDFYSYESTSLQPTPNLMLNYVGSGATACMAVPGPRRTQQTVAANTAWEYLRANPFESDAWHIDSPALPFPYVGRYYAAVITPDDNVLVLDDTVTYPCPHCAYIAGKAQAAARGPAFRGSFYMLQPSAREIPEFMRPRRHDAEIAGEERPQTTATIKDATVETAGVGRCCSNCGRMGHNSRGCTFPAKHYDRIGIEIEGRFLDYRAATRGIAARGGDGAGDGSIASSPESNAQPYELRTGPGSLREALEQLIEFYPDETDSSCGMHVHVSINQDQLCFLQTKQFFAYFKARWMVWGARMNLAPGSQFFKRLNGENDYCNENEDIYADMTANDRYSQLNFSAWRGHKTLECRLLPMFRRSSLGCAAVIELLDIYETFLADPASFGVPMPEDVDAGVPVALLTPLVLDPIYSLDFPTAMREQMAPMEIEMVEMPPIAPGMRRIALPVNTPITVERLAARLKAQAA